MGAQFGVIIVPRDGTRWKWLRFGPTSAPPTAAIRSAWSSHPARKQDVQRRDFTINGLLMRHDSGEFWILLADNLICAPE